MSIAGTTFHFGDLDALWPSVARRLRHIDPTDLEAIQQDCRSGQACCLSGPDGVVVFDLDLRATGTLFVQLAVSWGRAGAFARQESALCAIARDLGMAHLVFRASRRGWSRILGAQWEPFGHDGFRRAV